jgi:hypothetical protein
VLDLGRELGHSIADLPHRARPFFGQQIKYAAVKPLQKLTRLLFPAEPSLNQ